MFRKELPRLYELRDRIKVSNSKIAYFQDFENKLNDLPKREKFNTVEKELQGLDAAAWKFIRDEAPPYLTISSKMRKARGWEQLIDIILSQPRAYNYLKRIGCTNVQFISTMETPAPDLRGMIGSVKVLCEVKAIHKSDEEINARNNIMARTVNPDLEKGFFDKLKSVVSNAQKQLESFDSRKEAKHMVYINVDFDNWTGEFKETEFSRIDLYFADNPIAGCEIIIHNSRTLFHKPLIGKNITIDNAP